MKDYKEEAERIAQELYSDWEKVIYRGFEKEAYVKGYLDCISHHNISEKEEWAKKAKEALEKAKSQNGNWKMWVNDALDSYPQTFNDKQ